MKKLIKMLTQSKKEKKLKIERITQLDCSQFKLNVSNNIDTTIFINISTFRYVFSSLCITKYFEMCAFNIKFLKI